MGLTTSLLAILEIKKRSFTFVRCLSDQSLGVLRAGVFGTLEDCLGGNLRGLRGFLSLVGGNLRGSRGVSKLG